jgi:hypothetical protein
VGWWDQSGLEFIFDTSISYVIIEVDIFGFARNPPQLSNELFSR